MLLSILFALMGGLGWILFVVALMTNGFSTKYLIGTDEVNPTISTPNSKKVKVEYSPNEIIENANPYKEKKKVKIPKVVEVPKVVLPDTSDWATGDLLSLVFEKYNSVGGYCHFIKTLSDGRIAVQLEQEESPKYIIEFKDIRKNLSASRKRDEAAEALRNKAIEAEIARL